MCRVMCKPWDLTFKIFDTQLIKLNKYLLILPGSSAPKKIPPKELNEILLHAVPKDFAKQAYLQGGEFEGKSYKDKCDMFECM